MAGRRFIIVPLNSSVDLVTAQPPTLILLHYNGVVIVILFYSSLEYITKKLERLSLGLPALCLFFVHGLL